MERMKKENNELRAAFEVSINSIKIKTELESEQKQGQSASPNSMGMGPTSHNQSEPMVGSHHTDHVDDGHQVHSLWSGPNQAGYRSSDGPNSGVSLGLAAVTNSHHDRRLRLWGRV